MFPTSVLAGNISSLLYKKPHSLWTYYQNLSSASCQSWVSRNFGALHLFITLMSDCDTATFLVLPSGADYALSSMPRMLWISWYCSLPRQLFPLSAYMNTNLLIESLTSFSIWRSGWEQVKVINGKCLLKQDILIGSLRLDDNQKFVLFFIDKWIWQNKYGDARMVLGFSFQGEPTVSFQGGSWFSDQLWFLILCNLLTAPPLSPPLVLFSVFPGTYCGLSSDEVNKTGEGWS